MANNEDYINVDGIVLQQYHNEAHFRGLNVRQIRGVMVHFNIPLRDINGDILPQYRSNNGNFIRYRAPYINAVLAHFQQQQAPPQQPQDEQQSNDDQVSDPNSENDDDDIKLPDLGSGNSNPNPQQQNNPQQPINPYIPQIPPVYQPQIPDPNQVLW